MRLPHVLFLALVMSLVAVPARAVQNPQIESVGANTFALTQTATNGFDLNTDALKDLALKNASEFCAARQKQLKVVETMVWRPRFRTLGFSYAKVVFKALDADDPELVAPPAPPLAEAGVPPAAAEPGQPESATGQLYNDLLKLDDLRKRGILTEKEYQTQKKKVLKQSK